MKKKSEINMPLNYSKLHFIKFLSTFAYFTVIILFIIILESWNESVMIYGMYVLDNNTTHIISELWYEYTMQVK